jgi:hypothetical protein
MFRTECTHDFAPVTPTTPCAIPDEPRRLPSDLVIACDTEFKGPHTLTVQAAARISDDTIAVQVYHSPSVPGLPDSFNADDYLPVTEDRYGRFCKNIVIRPVKELSPDLSPSRIYRDLFDLDGLEFRSRSEGVSMIEQFGLAEPIPENVLKDKRPGRWRVPALKLTLVGHYLRADFGRIHGRDFLEALWRPDPSYKGQLSIREQKLISFVEKRGSRVFNDPTLEYLLDGQSLYQVEVQMRDTMFPYGPASLDSHSKTFLGLPKSDAVGQEDKEDMLRTFHDKTSLAYGYSMVDGVNTLLLYEQMQKKDREIYAAFGFREEETPPLRATLGSRVSTFLLRTAMKTAAGSKQLPSGRGLQDLMVKGGIQLLRDRQGISRYGEQTAQVHGGLLYSRSPTRFWHQSEGMLRDVDMSGCYQKVIEGISVYWGRPVILETGEKRMSLKEAVALVEQHAYPDGWVIRVTGKIETSPNALIPSPDNAVTSHNYRRKLSKGKRRQARQRAFHLEALTDPGSVKDTRSTKLYSNVVESGVVTRATWLLIQAMPEQLRREYEEMTADSVIFYPRKLVARDGAEFDALIEKYRSEALPWEATLDLDNMELVERVMIDADFITLKYPIGDYARRIGRFRKQAQQQEGKGSGADLAWKVHANTMYGVLVSSHMPTNNFVAGNVVTAQPRAEAFAMSQALNAIQTITDGCTYRLDQIPACTYEECLKLKHDYPINRAEDGDGIPFLDPKTIPQDDEDFTAWYRDHVKRFFRVEGGEYDALFGTHSLEHKKTSMSRKVVFDALACDGSGNYAKCTRDPEGNLAVEEFKARSYREESKELVQAWVLNSYSELLTCPSPLTSNKDLLSFKKAGQKARNALDQGVPEVYFPLGLEDRKLMNYKALKASAFIFQTPEQRAALVKQIQKFEEKTGCGLEALALRRSYNTRRQGSLTDLAGALYQLIREGKDNLKDLNPTKMSCQLKRSLDQRVKDISSRKQEAAKTLIEAIDTRNLTEEALITAYVVRKDDVRTVSAEAWLAGAA